MNFRVVILCSRTKMDQNEIFLSGIVREYLIPECSNHHATPAIVLLDSFLDFVGQPRFDLRLPGQTVSSRDPINAKNHPLRQIKIDPRFFMVVTNGFGSVEIVQHILPGIKPGFKILAVGLLFVHTSPLRWCAPGER